MNTTTSFENSTTDTPSLTKSDVLTIGYVDIGSASVSFLGALSILVYAVYKKKCCIQDVRPIFHLSLADLLATFSLLTTVTLYLLDEYQHINIQDFNTICHYISSVTMCFYISTFLLTFTFAVDIYIRYLMLTNTDSRHTKKKRFLYTLYVLSWFLPIAATIAIDFVTYQAGRHEMSNLVSSSHICHECIPIFHRAHDECWEGTSRMSWHEAYKYLFILPLLLVVIGNIVVYIFVIGAYRRQQAGKGLFGYHEHEGQWKITKKFFLYFLIFIFCWLPTLILGVWALVDCYFDIKEVFGFYIWQAACSPLQGLLNSIVYGWKREGFKRAVNETTPLNPTLSSSYTF